jgi:hypothetical protein
MAQTLKVLNAVRNYEIGIPITYDQYVFTLLSGQNGMLRSDILPPPRQPWSLNWSPEISTFWRSVFRSIWVCDPIRCWNIGPQRRSAGAEAPTLLKMRRFARRS